MAMSLVVLVPLAFDPGGYFIFLPIKLLLATVLVPLSIAALLWRGEETSVGSPHLMWSAFLLVLVVAALFGLGGIGSWVGSPDRGLGIVAWAIFAAAFWLGSSIRDRSDIRNVLVAAAAASIPISAYALFQAIGVDFIEWSKGIDITRARSTVGNAAFLGAYLAMIVPVSGRLVFDSAESRGARVIFALAGVGGLTALVSTQTRGAWLGVIAGAGVVALLEFRKLGLAPVRSALAIGAVVSIIVVLATVSPLASRLRTIVDPTTGTGRGRLIQWERTLALISARPILGWGPETYAFVFPQFIDEEFERVVGREVIPDRAHNVFLDVASAAGIIAALLYAGIAAVIAWGVLRARERGAVTVALAGGCAAYFTQLQFSFPVADLDVIFWLFAGLLVALIPLGTLRVSKGWATIFLVAAVAFGIWGSTDLFADRKLRNALDLEALGPFSIPAAQLRVDESASGIPRVKYLQAAARLHRRAGETSGSSEDFARGLRSIDRAQKIAPRDPELALDRADLLLSWGQISRRSDVLEDSMEMFESILEMDPNSSRVHLKIGVAFVELGRISEAERSWLRAAELSPRSAGPPLNLGLLYEQLGRREEAIELLDRALRLDPDNAFASETLRRLRREG